MDCKAKPYEYSMSKGQSTTYGSQSTTYGSQSTTYGSPIPYPKLNGGLYTGTPFLENAPWANVPVRPTTAYMTNVNLRTANPPVQALFQMQAGFRPGNNTDDMMPGLQAFIGTENFGPFNFACIPCFKKVPYEEEVNECERVIQIP